MEAERRKHGDSKHQRRSGFALSKAPSPSKKGTPVRSSRGGAHPQPGNRPSSDFVNLGPTRSWERTLEGKRPCQVCQKRKTFMGLIDDIHPGPVALDKAAAQIRARINLSTLDSIQVAAALSARCSAFLTNDRKIPPVPGLKVLQLRNYLSAR